MMNASDVKNVESLKLRLPHIFLGPVISLEFYKGWFPDIVKLCFELDDMLEDEQQRFSWGLLKEKFGTYRMHCDFQISRSSGQDSDDYDDLNDEETEERFSLIALTANVQKTIKLRVATFNNKCFVCSDAPTTMDHDGWPTTLGAFPGNDLRLARRHDTQLCELTAVSLKSNGALDGVSS